MAPAPGSGRVTGRRSILIAALGLVIAWLPLSAAHGGEKATFVNIDPMSIPLTKKNGDIDRYVWIFLSVEVKDKDASNDLFTMLPRLRHAFLRELYRGHLTKPDDTRRVDFQNVRKRLMSLVNARFADYGIKSIAITRVDDMEK